MSVRMQRDFCMNECCYPSAISEFLIVEFWIVNYVKYIVIGDCVAKLICSGYLQKGNEVQ